MTRKISICLTKIPPHHKIVKTHGDGTLQSLIPARAAFAKDVKWPDKTIIKIGFLRKKFIYNDNDYLDPNFTYNKASWVKSTIEKYFINSGMVNLSFQWDVPLADSDIRICFIKSLGAWSVLGTQSLTVPKDQPTMNLGWLDTNNDYDFPAAAGTAAVVIHEFGHAIGLIHEHSREDAKSLRWNKDAVYKQLGDPPNNWSTDECDEQIFKAQEFDSSNSSQYDPESIMHYYFPDDYFYDPKPHLKHIAQLSDIDIKTIKNRYPGGGGKSIGDISSKSTNNWLNNNWLNKHWYWILIGLTLLIMLTIMLK